MQSEFFSFYYPGDEKFNSAWTEGLFVPDTNVLLNIYRYPKETSAELLQILGNIADRLWIPHQVALEYQRNRMTVVIEQIEKYDAVKKAIEGFVNSVEGKLLSDLKLSKRHPRINPNTFIGRVRDAATEFNIELDNLKNEQPGIFDDDSIRTELERLFDGKIGPRPTAESLNAIYKEGETRFSQLMPPGFKDTDKTKRSDGSFNFAGNYYRGEFGDLILWKQLIDEVKVKKTKYVIFITDDVKPDWWSIYESQGQTMRGPRRELQEEIRQQANVELFYTYDSEQFLRNAVKYLNAAVKEESIEEVRKVTRPTVFDTSRKSQLAEQAVMFWAKEHAAPTSTFSYGSPIDFFDFSFRSEQGIDTGFIVKYFEQPMTVRHFFRERSYRIFYELTTHETDQAYICFVTSSEENAREAASRPIQIPEELSDRISVIIGYLAISDKTAEPILQVMKIL